VFPHRRLPALRRRVHGFGRVGRHAGHRYRHALGGWSGGKRRGSWAAVHEQRADDHRRRRDDADDQADYAEPTDARCGPGRVCRWRGAQGLGDPGGDAGRYGWRRMGVSSEPAERAADSLLRKPGITGVHRSIVTHCIAPRRSGTVAALSKYPRASASLARAREQRLFTVPSATPSIRAVSATE
jgi:hypothetical protein